MNLTGLRGVDPDTYNAIVIGHADIMGGVFNIQQDVIQGTIQRAIMAKRWGYLLSEFGHDSTDKPSAVIFGGKFIEVRSEGSTIADALVSAYILTFK